ncbi:hypothetical protein [uncultured Anoxybacillus sp.]|uniref:hypothetical protein n=1 Tax=uncultured Anoxybacillus sp. TaxID=263860 RepID=UPI00260E7D99|nr:hypothetical protein [uncultured Anoxybacillus sp.]
MPIRAKIVAPDGTERNRREIFFRDREIYDDQLPLDMYPITHLVNREGIGVILTDGHHECEASLHRYDEFFYIGSAYRRLGSRDYTRKFRRFLEEVGIVNEGTLVMLEFEEYRIHISRI